MNSKDQEALANQLNFVTCVRSMINRRFRIIYLFRKPCKRFIDHVSSEPFCLGVVDIITSGKKNKAALIVRDGYIYSLEYKYTLKFPVEIIGYSSNQKWKSREKSLEKIEHGNGNT